MSTGAALAFLDRKIAELRRVPQLMKAIAPEVAAEVRAELTRTLAAGQSPDGVPWAPRKDDGGRAYAGAASKLTVTASGSHILASIEGPEVYGQRGARGMAKRQMLPTAITAGIAARLTRLMIRRFAAHFAR